MINVALIGLGRIGMMHAKNILDHKYLNLHSIYEKDKLLSNLTELKKDKTIILISHDSSFKKIADDEINLTRKNF